jgi:hypothetical protein
MSDLYQRQHPDIKSNKSWVWSSQYCTVIMKVGMMYWCVAEIFTVHILSNSRVKIITGASIVHLLLSERTLPYPSVVSVQNE